MKKPLRIRLCGWLALGLWGWAAVGLREYVMHKNQPIDSLLIVALVAFGCVCFVVWGIGSLVWVAARSPGSRGAPAVDPPAASWPRLQARSAASLAPAPAPAAPGGSLPACAVCGAAPALVCCRVHGVAACAGCLAVHDSPACWYSTLARARAAVS
jgi:hypothetical protein